MAYLNRTTKQWQEIDTAHHLHPFTDYKSLAKEGSIIVTKADGVHLTTSDDKQLLDAMSGLWCVNVGYGRKNLADVAYKQMQELPYYNSFFKTATPPSIELAKELAEISPHDLNHAFFSSSGSEANDTVVRMVRRYWDLKGKPNKKTFISREYAYHGSTMTGMSLGGMTAMHSQGDMMPGFEHVLPPYWYKYGSDMSHDDFGIHAANKIEEKINEIGPDNIAAFIGEPIQGAGGVIIPPDTYWPRVQEICKKYDILLVVDEVICGFGRTGNLWGCDTYNIKPDIIISSKCLTAGYFPMGAVIVNKEFSDKFVEVSEEAEEFPHGFTAGGHPVGCAIALKAIDVIMNEGLLDNIKLMEPYFFERLNEFNDYEHIGETRGIGLMAALEMVKNKDTKEPFEGHLNMGDKVANLSIDNGLICRPLGPAIVLCPQFIITKNQIDEIFDSLHKTIKQVFN